MTVGSALADISVAFDICVDEGVVIIVVEPTGANMTLNSDEYCMPPL